MILRKSNSQTRNSFSKLMAVELQEIHKLYTMIIQHVKPHWVRLQSAPMLQCLIEMQYQIPRSIAALAIMHVMSRPGAVSRFNMTAG